MADTRPKIIIVDDNMANLAQVRTILKSLYEVYPASSVGKLFTVLEHSLPDLILMDIDMPEIDGFKALEMIKASSRFACIPVIFLTGKIDESSELKGFSLGAVDYVTKPFSAPLLLKRIEKELAFSRQAKQLMESNAAVQYHAANLETLVQQKVETIVSLQNAVLTTVSDLVEFRDRNTGGHITRTQGYLKALIDTMVREGVYTDILSGWDIDAFLASAQLHDVGKIAVPDSILCKPGPLTPEEFEIMKTHVPVGVDAIERIISSTAEHAFLRHALAIVGTHHERWNGTGYPAGLTGQNIPLEGRLMAIADVYDALISTRPYKKSYTHEEACRIIMENSGVYFDPVLVEVFGHSLEAISRAYTHEEACRIIMENSGVHFDPVLVDVFGRSLGAVSK